jgi:lysine/ornithine N-monooxygenase
MASPHSVLRILPKAPIITTEAPTPMMKFLRYLNEADLRILFMLVEMFFLLKNKLLRHQGKSQGKNH